MEPKRKRLRSAAEHAPQDAALSTAARLVLTRTQPAIASLVHVAQSISGCLDWSTKWTLETTSKTNYLLLLDRLAAQEWSGVGQDFREARFLYNIRTAAREGNVAVLNWWRTKYLPNGPDVAAAILHLAAYTDHLHVIQWLYQVDDHAQSLGRMARPLDCALPAIVYWMQEHQPQVQMEICLEDAAYQGDLEFIKWVQGKSYSYILTQGTIEAAAAGGHLHVLQHLISHVPDVQMMDACRNACSNGHLDTITWISKNYDVDVTRTCMVDTIIANAHFHVVKWLVEQYEWSEESIKEEWIVTAMVKAALYGNMEILQYLFDHKANPNAIVYILDSGVDSGKLEIGKWLHDRNYKSERDLVSLAANTGRFEMLKWVHENCVVENVSTDAMDFAAQHNLEMVKFLHDHRSEGCTTDAMDNAARSGRLDIVKFLRENRFEGCTSIAMNFSAINGDLQMVEYLNQVCSKECTVEAMTAAAVNGHLEVVKYLHKHCSERNTSLAMRAAASSGMIKIVKWLYENGLNDCDDVDAAYKEAVVKGYSDIVIYLALQCGDRCTRFDVGKAAKRGHFYLLEWLMKCGPESVTIDANRDMRPFRLVLSPEYSPCFDEV